MYAVAWLEPMATLSFASSITERVALGPGVLLLPLRNPVILAKEIASIQALSGNRFIFGVGTGHYAPELSATGARVSERGKRTDEVLELVKRLVAGETVSYEGSGFKLDAVTIEPSPRPLPVWVGGGSQIAHRDSVETPVMHPNVARRIARSDGWFSRPSASPEQIADDWRQLQTNVRDEGRDPSQIEIAHGQWLHLTEQSNGVRAREIQHLAARDIVGHSRAPDLLEQSYLFGTLDEVVEACRRRTDIGVEHLIIHPYTDDPEQLELWGSLLLPRLRELEVSAPTL
jgi:alkanesulfonate monooxygenase SsuD/methylene tetrahydromethanopterin reductase-like flavin-dependent oxidoreductase (luciferase family)